MDKKPFAIMLDEELLAKIKQKAKELGLTTSAYIRMIIINYLNEKEN